MRAIAACALFITACLPLRAQSIDEFFEEVTTEWIRGDPSQATFLRYFEGEEQDRLDRQITPLTRAYQAKRAEEAGRILKRLRRYNRSKMTDVERVSAELLEWQLEAIITADEFADYRFPLNQFRGANTELPRGLLRVHPMSSARDAESYVAKLEQIAPRMREAIAEAKRIESQGILPPRFILSATIRQMQRFADPSPASNPLATTLDKKAAKIAEISEEQRTALVARAAEIIGKEIYPAWHEATALLESQLEEATDEAGLSRLDGGAEAYAERLRYFTTTELAANEIHEIGLKEVARLEARMEGLFHELGRTGGSVATRMAQLKKDQMYPDPTSEASRAQVIPDIEMIVREAQKRAESLFDIRPKAAIEVQPVPTFMEANMPPNYSVPASDGSRPGIYQFPRTPDWMTKVLIRPVTYHEAVPGHHFQRALLVENKALPKFRQTRAFGRIDAFTEGWGLYAERLVVERGWYEGDLEGLLGALDSQLFRARRLVVDTGLHSKGWTRQEAIDYGMPVSEVERYVVLPGQACSYMTGQLKIVELREKAKAGFEELFSLDKFHNLILQTGDVPLTLLETEVDRYIASKQ